jgi:carbamate kinase
VEDQYAAVEETCRHIAGLVKAGYRVVVTHGNGPQVGFILRRSELAAHELHQVPLDSCGADTQGAIGYMFQRAMYNEMKDWPQRPAVATVVTQVLVDRNDPSFKPSKSAVHDDDRDGAPGRPLGHLEDAGRGSPGGGVAGAGSSSGGHPPAAGERHRGGRGGRWHR